MAKQTSTSQWRLDEPHFQPPNPHMYELPERPEIELLLLQLDDDELDFRDFSQRLGRFPGLNRYVVALANYYLSGKGQRIEDSAHAATVLGISGLQRYIEPLTRDDQATSRAG